MARGSGLARVGLAGVRMEGGRGRAGAALGALGGLGGLALAMGLFLASLRLGLLFLGGHFTIMKGDYSLADWRSTASGSLRG